MLPLQGWLRPEWQPAAGIRAPTPEHVFQRWSVGCGGRRGHPPGTAEGRACYGLLHGHRQDAPPPACPARLGGAPDGGWGSKCADPNQIAHQTEGSTIPSASHLRPKHDEALRADGRKFRVCCPFAPLGNAQRGSVDICAAWLRLARSRQRRNERGVTAQCDPVGRRPIDEQVQAATVCRLYAGSRRVCQPWLRDNVAFWSHCLARHSDPCPLYHFGSASEQTRSRAG